MREWFAENQGAFEGQVLFDEPLSRHTYYRIGGPARVLVFPKSRADLVLLARGLRMTGAECFVLGAGSNLLASDQGFEGVVVRAGRLNLEIAEIQGCDSIRTGGSVATSTLLRRAATEGWGGLELLSGDPGIGRWRGRDERRHAPGRIQRRARERRDRRARRGGRRQGARLRAGLQLRYEYRRNLYLPKNCVVWEALLAHPARRAGPGQSADRRTLASTKATQPVEYPSCGSVFKNPKAEGRHAWQVLDELGLRGHRLGGAQISEKHSNFIVNLGGAKASDVRGLIELAKARAASSLGSCSRRGDVSGAGGVSRAVRSATLLEALRRWTDSSRRARTDAPA